MRRKGNENAAILLRIDSELRAAAKAQPCPACKHDMEVFSGFLEAKARALKTREPVGREHFAALKEVDFINELTGVGALFARTIRPFTFGMDVPEIYKKTLQDDLAGNREVLRRLKNAAGLMKGIEPGDDRQYALMLDIMNGFRRATEFKLSIDPLTFYIFDKTIRLGYRTHLLSATGKVIVGFKQIANPSRYR